MGYDSAQCGEGTLYETATLTCCHCGTVVIKNPERQRKRENCQKCGGDYVCDNCYAIMQSPDYIHIPIRKWADDTLEDSFRQENDYQRIGNPLLK